MISNRNKWNGENIKESDFIHGIGFDYNLIKNFMTKSSDNSYYHEDGISIDGTVRVKRYHPLLNKILINKEEDKKVVIEAIHKHWHYGYYWTLIYRTLGTQSHGVLIYKNINSIDSVVLESVLEAREKYIFEDPYSNFDIE